MFDLLIPTVDPKFYALALWTTCVNLWLIHFQNIVFTSLITNKWINRVTNGQENGHVKYTTDYIQTMLISLQGAEWHGTGLHTGLMCAGVNCFYPLCSPLRSSWRPGHPSYQTTSRESSIQRRRSCGVEQFAAGHSYCINNLFFQKSAQDSSIFSFISIIYLIPRSVCCTVPL